MFKQVLALGLCSAILLSSGVPANAMTKSQELTYSSSSDLKVIAYKNTTKTSTGRNASHYVGMSSNLYCEMDVIIQANEYDSSTGRQTRVLSKIDYSEDTKSVAATISAATNCFLGAKTAEKFYIYGANKTDSFKWPV